MMIIPPPPRKWREPHRCPSQQGTRESLKIIEIITVVIIIIIVIIIAIRSRFLAFAGIGFKSLVPSTPLSLIHWRENSQLFFNLLPTNGKAESRQELHGAADLENIRRPAKQNNSDWNWQMWPLRCNNAIIRKHIWYKTFRLGVDVALSSAIDFRWLM